ncbi:MAG: GNAT family N-acetyltransferase [Firmicutes bacterium]|nr:GNAT family N-acetyltransferase [Bacillota bacterium]
MEQNIYKTCRQEGIVRDEVFMNGKYHDRLLFGLTAKEYYGMCPNFRKDLTTVIKAPNGDYACFAGMWFDEINKYAYLEPLATVPEYRRIGLATIALTEAMKKIKALGATYCFSGVPEFYTAIGFETICHRKMWKKEW